MLIAYSLGLAWLTGIIGLILACSYSPAVRKAAPVFAWLAIGATGLAGMLLGLLVTLYGWSYGAAETVMAILALFGGLLLVGGIPVAFGVVTLVIVSRANKKAV